MPYATNGDIRIHYTTEGEGPPLVLHHWSFATLDDWYDWGYVSALKGDYRLILLDARGHGSSDKSHDPEAYALEHRVNDVVAVLDDLGLAKAHFFGYSMGGWVGFGVAAHAPRRFHSVVIGGQHPYEQSLQELRDLLQHGVEGGPEVFISVWEENFGSLAPEQKERMRRVDFEALLAVAHDRSSLESVLPNMTVPCLLIVGGLDLAYPAAQKCAQQMPDAKFITVPGVDHIEGLRRCDLLLPHVTQFLKIVGP